ncbi:MAG: magnesium transporter ATPase, partial [Mycobacterium sp.]|nr:magnesium transporter ATPase [Mycobacterium sp.]
MLLTAPMTDQALTTARVCATPVAEVLGWLDSSTDGLTGAEAAARLVRDGPNALRTHRVSAIAVL